MTEKFSCAEHDRSLREYQYRVDKAIGVIVNEEVLPGSGRIDVETWTCPYYGDGTGVIEYSWVPADSPPVELPSYRSNPFRKTWTGHDGFGQKVPSFGELMRAIMAVEVPDDLGEV
jgi:hypothetical protein